MDDLRLIPFRHDVWATQILLDVCRPLAPDQFDQSFEMGPGSIRRTFLHMISAKVFWTDQLRGQTRDDYPPDTHRSASVDEIAALHRATSADFEQLAISLIEANRLSETIPASPRPNAPQLRVGSVLIHVPNHGTHHRAQILNMLRRLGVQPLPAIDVDDWEQMQ